MLKLLRTLNTKPLKTLNFILWSSYKKPFSWIFIHETMKRKSMPNVLEDKILKRVRKLTDTPSFCRFYGQMTCPSCLQDSTLYFLISIILNLLSPFFVYTQLKNTFHFLFRYLYLFVQLYRIVSTCLVLHFYI